MTGKIQWWKNDKTVSKNDDSDCCEKINENVYVFGNSFENESSEDELTKSGTGPKKNWGFDVSVVVEVIDGFTYEVYVTGRASTLTGRGRGTGTLAWSTQCTGRTGSSPTGRKDEHNEIMKYIILY